MPLPVYYCKELIFVKHEGVTFADSLEEMLAQDEVIAAINMPNIIDLTEIPSDDDEPMYSSPSDRKGKGRAY